jgi:hypothetical protein
MGIERGRAATKKGERTYTGIGLADVADSSDPNMLKLSPEDFSMEESFDGELSECQQTGKPFSFIEMPACPVCGSDTFWRQQAGGPIMCAKCRPYRDLEEVAELLYVRGEIELCSDGEGETGEGESK